MIGAPHPPLLRRLPIESGEPLVLLALVRLVLVLTALVTVAGLGLPYDGRLAGALLLLGLPWALLNLALAARSPERAANPLVALGDLALVSIVGAISPESFGAVRFTVLFLLAVHANVQGERIGVGLALLAIGLLAIPGALQDHGEIPSDLLVFDEIVFAIVALATVVLVGRLRTTESAGRLRARELSRRALGDEQDVRRRVAESLHDGPLQELIGLDMVLTAAHRKAEEEGAAATAGLLERARETSARNVDALRDEMLELGPYAFEELSLGAAVERCVPLWRRRYELATTLLIDDLDLSSNSEGELFRIIQESVVNAARHGGAGAVTIELRRLDEGRVRLSIADDGAGFGAVDSLGPSEPGHIGLAGIRERAALLGGTLEIDSSAAGSTVAVTFRPKAGP